MLLEINLSNYRTVPVVWPLNRLPIVFLNFRSLLSIFASGIFRLPTGEESYAQAASQIESHCQGP